MNNKFAALRARVDETAQTWAHGGATPSLCRILRESLQHVPSWAEDVVEAKDSWPSTPGVFYVCWVNAYAAETGCSRGVAVCAWREWALGRISKLEEINHALCGAIPLISSAFRGEVGEPLDYFHFSWAGQKSLTYSAGRVKGKVVEPLTLLGGWHGMLYDVLHALSSQWGDDYPLHSKFSNDFGGEWMERNAPGVKYPEGVPIELACRCHADWQTFANKRIQAFEQKASLLTI